MTTMMTARTRNWLTAYKKYHVTKEASAATTQAQSENPVVEPVHLHVADLVIKVSIIAIAADKDDSFDYYLLKITSDGPVLLKEDVIDDYFCAFSAGSTVLKGHFFLRDNLIDMTYKLDQKRVAVVSWHCSLRLFGAYREEQRPKESFSSCCRCP